VVGELAAAIRARGIRAGLGYPGGMDWTFKGLPIRNGRDMAAATPQTPEYVAYVEAHWRELIDRYEPAVLWNDYCYPRGGDPLAVFRYYLERVPDGVINNRWHDDIEVMEPYGPYSDFITPEYQLVDGVPECKWEAIRAIGASFGYNRQESERTDLSAEQLIHLFVDIVARGGNLLLGISPTATGELPWRHAQRLLELGWWLRMNGEAIYGTRPWEKKTMGMTETAIGIRYTRSPDAVHAIVLGTPRGTRVDIDVRLEPGATVSLDGRRGTLDWENSPCGVRVALPEARDPQPALSLRLAPPEAASTFRET
jgi:alpha-L-fucosidase